MLLRYFAIFMGVCILLGCENQEAPKKIDNIIPADNDVQMKITIAYSGELLGELEPCGCSGSKLGGMILRSGWVQNLKDKYPGLILIDGGFASRKWELQDQMKFKVHHQVLESLGYQIQFVSHNEKIPTKLSKPSLLFGCGKEQNWYSIQKISDRLCVLFVTVEKDKLPDPLALAKILQKENPTVVWVMSKGIFENYQNIIPEGNYLTVILPVDAQAPFSPSKISPKLFVVSAGNRGRYKGIMQIQVSKDEKIDDYEKHIENRIIALEKNNEPVKEVVQLLDQYKKELQEKQLLEMQIKRSSPIGFVGSDSCRSCHQYEHSKWKENPHARAFATLVNEKHDYDPECVGCHTVGFEFEEGFRTVEETPYLIDVGCEACHGPGAQHIMKQVKGTYGKTDGERMCLVCHEKDRSPHFDYTKFLEKIKHWKD